MKILIKKGRVIDPSVNLDGVNDIYIEDNKIFDVGIDLSNYEREDVTVIDAKGKYVLPGLVDLHVHFRDPGQTQKEDIESGSKAAAKGGVTTVVTMPNTRPTIDSVDRYKYVENKAKEFSKINILQSASITVGERGTDLTDIRALREAGVMALSEDGRSVANSNLYRKAMEITSELHIPILAHCEDDSLRGSGCMNLDHNSKRLGLIGIPNSTEDVIAARDIILALEAKAPLHLCHCSTKGVAKIMEVIKKDGVDFITAEVCPHHFILSTDDIPCDDPNYKMNPPLRTKEDVKALCEGLKNDYFEVISTDHAPHTKEDKGSSFKNGAFGIVGIETSLALAYTYLVEKKVITLNQLVEKMSLNPSRILGFDRGTLNKGRIADVIVVDFEKEYTIDKNTFVSKGKNTPFDGYKVKGDVLYTICNGEIVYKKEESI